MQSQSSASGAGPPRPVTRASSDSAGQSGIDPAHRPQKRRRQSGSSRPATNATVLSQSPQRQRPAEFATNAAYARWLETIQHGYGAFVETKVRATFHDNFSYDGIVCSIYHSNMRSQSEWRQPAPDSELPTRDKPLQHQLDRQHGQSYGPEDAEGLPGALQGEHADKRRSKRGRARQISVPSRALR